MTELLADRLLRRAGSPGLVDSAAVQAEVARKLAFLGLLSPLLQRLLARAAEDGADGFAGGALPLTAPFAFSAGALFAAPMVAPEAAEAPPRSLPLPAAGSPPHLVRVSRRVRLAGTAPPGTGDGARMIAAGPAPPPAATREIGAAATTPASPLRIAAPAHGGGEGAAAPVPLGRSPALRSGALPPLDRSEDRGLPAVPHIASLPKAPEKMQPEPIGMPRRGTTLTHPAPTLTLSRTAGEGADPRITVRGEAGEGGATGQIFPHHGGRAARWGSPGQGPLPRAAPGAAPVGAVPRVPELHVPRAGHGATGVNEAPMGRTTVVPELPGRASPRAPVVLPAPFAEEPRRADQLRPAMPVAAEPASRGRGPVEPNPAAAMASRPAAPAMAALAGAELERLADKVSRMIARRVAVERERRGR